VVLVSLKSDGRLPFRALPPIRSQGSSVVVVGSVLVVSVRGNIGVVSARKCACTVESLSSLPDDLVRARIMMTTINKKIISRRESTSFRTTLVCRSASDLLGFISAASVMASL